MVYYVEQIKPRPVRPSTNNITMNKLWDDATVRRDDGLLHTIRLNRTQSVGVQSHYTIRN